MKNATLYVGKLFEIVQFIKKFSIEWVKSTGEIVRIENAKCSSFHSNGETLNVVNLDNGQVRKVNRLTITRINNLEIVI